MTTTAYFLSHNGLGDNLYSVGALRFLAQYYDTIYFLCKDKYSDNVKTFFTDEPRIVCLPFDSTCERDECHNILGPVYAESTADVFICGAHKHFFRSRITHPKVLEYKADDRGYDLNYDTINENNYGFLRGFYTDINLDMHIYYDYFKLAHHDVSMQIYDTVKHYKHIVFVQTDASFGEKLNIQRILAKYNHDEDSIVISNNSNLYKPTDVRYRLCQPFILNRLAYYVELIKNCTEIYIIDSCMTGIVLPLLKTGQLKASVVRIVQRDGNLRM